MSSFFSFFYSKPKAEEVMASTSLTSEAKLNTEDSQSEPQSPVNLLSPPLQTQPQTSPSYSPSGSQPQTPKEQENSKTSTVSEEHSYSDDEILSYISENNELNVSWSKVMKIIRERLEKTCHDSDIQIAINGEDLDKDEKHKTDVETYKQTINQLLDNFERPPFTIQRLSELILKPFQHHKTLIKWLRAVEKVLTVQSSLDAFPSISNTIALTDKLELMEVTTSPKLVPISFAYNAEEIEKENANSPKLVPIKFTYNAELEVADNEEDDDMNEDYYYGKQEIDTPEDDLDEMDEEKFHDIDEENYDMFEEKSEDNLRRIIKKKRDYDVEDDMSDENEGNVKKMTKKKKDNVEGKIIEEADENIFEDIEKDDNLFEEEDKIVEIKEKEKETIENKMMEEKGEEYCESIKNNMINEKDKNLEEVIDEKMIKEKSDEKTLDKTGKENGEHVEDIKEKKKKSKDQEEELLKEKNEYKVLVMNEEKSEEEKLKEVKEKIKMRIK